MIFHFKVFFWTLIFFLGLEFIAINRIFPSWDGYIFSCVPLLFISFLGSRRLTGNYRDAFLPALLALVSPTLLSLIDHPTERQIFVIVSAMMYYVSLLGIYRLRHAPKDRTAHSMINASA